MNKLIVFAAAFALAIGCGAQKEEPGADAPETAADKVEPSASSEGAGNPAGEPACEGAATAEAQCVCPDDYEGEPPCPRAAAGKPCGCENCPADCECKGGDKPCPMKAAAGAAEKKPACADCPADCACKGGDKPCKCEGCPADCACKGGDKPCPMKAAAAATSPN